MLQIFATASGASSTTAADLVNYALNLVWVAAFVVFLVYGARIQIYLSLRKVGGSLRSLEKMRDDTKTRLIQELAKYGGDTNVIKADTDRLLSSIVIDPVSMDPSGIVYKLDHLIKTYEDYFKSKVAKLTPTADKVARQNLSNLVEVGMALDYLYRYVRHLYASAKKYSDLFAVIQLQMSLSTIMDSASAYYAATDAFSKGEPIGDSLGPLVASKLMVDTKPLPVAEETVYSEVNYEGRKLLVVKAEGPGGTVGRPGEAVEKLLEMHPEASLVITVDAGLKLEGENSGEVVEGVGAAIGGPGVDRYRIEGAATNREIPMYAIVVKMSEKEAITRLKDELRAQVDEVLRRLRRLLYEKTEANSTVLVAGIGNTIGIA